MVYRYLSRQLRKSLTNPERLLWQHLRFKQMGNYKFRRQHPLGNYILDFVCLEAKLIIEIDGGQHNEEINNKKDQERTRWLEQKGFKILRFWNHEIFLHLTEVKEVIGRELGII